MMMYTQTVVVVTACLIMGAAGAKDLSWCFERDGDAEGWSQASPCAKLSIADGKARLSGPRPLLRLSSEVPYFDSADFNFLIIRAETLVKDTSKPANLTIWYKGASAADFAGLRIPIPPSALNNGYQRLTVDMKGPKLLEPAQVLAEVFHGAHGWGKDRVIYFDIDMNDRFEEGNNTSGVNADNIIGQNIDYVSFASEPGFEPDQAQAKKAGQTEAVISAELTSAIIARNGCVRESGPAAGLPDATSENYNTPHAIRFEGRHNRTYVVYGDVHSNPFITFFDHQGKRWAVPQQVGTSATQNDSHSNPALAISKDGFLYVVYGAHNAEQNIRRSVRQEDISEWGPVQVVSPKATYANMYFLGDTLYLFHRDTQSGKPLWGFRTSNDGGATWSELQPVFDQFPDGYIAYPNMYIEQRASGPVMHVFSLIFGHNRWYNMYYAVSRDLGKTWETASGKPIPHPIQYEQGELVFEGNVHGWQNEIVVDPAGRPGLLFVTGGPGIVDNNAAMFAYWTGNAWQASKICDADARYCHGTCLARGEGKFQVYFPRGSWRGGEIGQWETADGGATWAQTRDITQNSPAPNNFIDPVVNGTPEVELIWCAGTKSPGTIHAWGEEGVPGAAASAAAAAAQTTPDGWETGQFRIQARPVFAQNATGGPSGKGSLTIAADGSAGLDGFYRKAFPVTGDKYFGFRALRKPQGLAAPGQQTLVEIVWRNEKNQPVKGWVPEAKPATFELGAPGPAYPDYPQDGATDKNGWTEVTGVYRVPLGATQAVVTLELKWPDPYGSAEWSDVSFVEVPAPAERKVRLAACHLDVDSNKTPQQNREAFGRLVEEAARQKADLVATMELLTLGAGGFEAAAETVPGPSTAYFGQLAKKHNLYIAVGLLERDNHLLYNTAVLLGPDGAIVGSYRKVCLTRAEVTWGICGGNDFPVFNTRFGKVGMMLCYDAYFPEVARNLAAQGADVVAFLVQGADPAVVTARAVENQVYIVTGTRSAAPGWLKCGVMGRRGEWLVESGKMGEVVVAEVDLNQQTKWWCDGDMKARMPKERPSCLPRP